MRRARGSPCQARPAADGVAAPRAAHGDDNAPMSEELIRRSMGPVVFDAAATAVMSRQLPPQVQAAGLSLAEKVAVYAWTVDTSSGLWFARINAVMRMAELAPGELETVLPVAHALPSALRKLPPFVGTVYRGVKERPIGAEEFERFVREHETLTQVYHAGFVGASVVEGGALRGRAKLIIRSRTGRDISSLSAKPEQIEVLFLPPLKLAPERVIRGKVVRIWANEI
jgi:hypothetical protein